MWTKGLLLTGTALLLVLPANASAQVIITPGAGFYFQASSFDELESASDEVRVEREGTLGLTVGVEFGLLRLSLAYASGATLNEEGVQNGDEIGDGSLLAATAGVSLKLLQQSPIRPYLMAGAGLKRAGFSFEDGAYTGLPDSQTDFAGHLGVGLALAAGPIGVALEVSDFITLADSGPHDVFVTLGIRVGPF
jgi:hypothetical protein